MARHPEEISDEKLHELGKDLLLWVQTEGRHHIQFVRWYYAKHNLSSDSWRNLKKRNEFRPYHELAMKIMSENIVLNKEIAQSYGNRYLCYYDRDLLEHEEEIKDKDAQRGTSVNQNINVEQLNALVACLQNFSQKKQILTDTTTVEGHTDLPPELGHDPEGARDP